MHIIFRVLCEGHFFSLIVSELSKGFLDYVDLSFLAAFAPNGVVDQVLVVVVDLESLVTALFGHIFVL